MNAFEALAILALAPPFAAQVLHTSVFLLNEVPDFGDRDCPRVG